MTRYDTASLVAFARDIFERAGLSADRATVCAEVLVEGDLLGHTTHGLALLELYAGELMGGGMTAEGDPITL